MAGNNDRQSGQTYKTSGGIVGYCSRCSHLWIFGSGDRHRWFRYCGCWHITLCSYRRSSRSLQWGKTGVKIP